MLSEFRICDDDATLCKWLNDGTCDDGGAGSEYSECSLGTDCKDCGTRLVTPAPTPAPTPPTSAPTPAPTIVLSPMHCWSKKTVYRKWHHNAKSKVMHKGEGKGGGKGGDRGPEATTAQDTTQDLPLSGADASGRIQAYLIARHGETRADCAGKKLCSCWEGKWSCASKDDLINVAHSDAAVGEGAQHRSLQSRRSRQSVALCHDGGDGVSTCAYSNDGECDDGGSGASYQDCDLGHDCADCGKRWGTTSYPTATPTNMPTPYPEPASECSVRREWGELGRDELGYDEKELFINAWLWVAENCNDEEDPDPTHTTQQQTSEELNTAKSRPVCGYMFGTEKKWTFQQFLQNHLLYDKEHAHLNNKFLPWHRVYLAELESKLQLFHPCVSIPYWDWTLDSGKEASAHIFEKQYLGDADHIGRLLGTDLDHNSYTQHLPPGWPFARSSTGQIQGEWPGGQAVVFADRAVLTQLMAQSSYSLFRPLLEGTPHAAPHVYVGGHMSTMMAPSDPFFWLHHAMVDRVWDDWQKLPRFKDGALREEGLLASYSGDDEEVVSPQWPNTRVKDTFDSRRQLGVCYSPLKDIDTQAQSAKSLQQQCLRSKLQLSDLVVVVHVGRHTTNFTTASSATASGIAPSSSAPAVTTTALHRQKTKRTDNDKPVDGGDQQVSVTAMGAFALRMGWSLEEFLEADNALHNC